MKPIEHRCRACGANMIVTDCSHEPSIIAQCPQGCDDLIVCMPFSFGAVLPMAFWKSELPSGVTLIAHARQQAGNQAHLYGLADAV